VTEINEQDDLIHLSAYAPTRLAKIDVKNSSSYKPKIFPWCFAIGLHALLLWLLYKELQTSKTSLPEEIITFLEFIEPATKAKPIEVMPDMQIRKKSDNIYARTISPLPLSIKTDPQINHTVRPRVDQALRLYDDTGRIALPVDFIEKYDEKNSNSMRFDFRNPDLELAGTFLKRPPAIDFNPTQFEDAWKPDQDILTELLEKAVEKTTKEIKIPVPGNPGVMLVCKVSVLALGGGCGFVPNGGYGRVIPDNEDDPNTLSPREDRECQAWWEKISNTISQREWLKTKELYEITCKKPLAKEKIKLP
jgi:hypothetical protein